MLQHELILNSAGEGVCGLDLGGNFSFVNAAAEQITGYTAQELIGKNSHEILHFKKADGTPYSQEEDPLYSCLRDGKTIRIPGEIFRKTQGDSFPVEYVIAPIKEDNRLMGAVVIFRDTSVRKEAQQELREAKNFLENILDNSAAAIGVVDKHGRFTRWNKAAVEIFGYSFKELEGKLFTELYADKNELAAMLAQLRRDGYVRRYDIDMKKKDGSIVPFAMSIQVLYDHNENTVGSVCVARDRSDVLEAVNELKKVNNKLRQEISERHQVQKTLQKTNARFEAILHEAEQRQRDMALLNELGDILQACLTWEEAYTAVSHFGKQLFPENPGELFVLNTSRNWLEAVTSWGEDIPGEQVFPPDDCWAFRRGEVHFAKGGQTGLFCKHIATPCTADHMCIPMIAQGEIIGLLLKQGPPSGLDGPVEASRQYQARSQQRLALTFAKQISLALSSMKLRDTLRSQAIRDPLTHLFNRRYMEETFDRELQRVIRKKSSLSAIMVDVDNLKKINDAHGHEAGDALLEEVASLLAKNIRQEDIACRYAGDEFVLILPEASLEISHQRADHLRKLINHLQVWHNGRLLARVTASIGVATFPAHGLTRVAIIQAADEALYRAKKEGRNRVVVAQALEANMAEVLPVIELQGEAKMAGEG